MITKYKYITISQEERLALGESLHKLRKMELENKRLIPTYSDLTISILENLLKRSKHKEDEKN